MELHQRTNVCLYQILHLTSEVLRQAQQETHSLVVALWTAGGTKHQGLCTGGPRGPEDAVDISAMYHLDR